MEALTENQIARLRCEACGQKSLKRVNRQFTKEISHDGRPPVKIEISDLSVAACMNPKCPPNHPDHAVIWDDAALWRITTETYRQLGLLTPDEIRASRERLGRTQQELQDLLGLGGNTLSRWESGRIYQSRAMDTLLRLVFRNPESLTIAAKIHRPTSTSKSQTNATRQFPYLKRDISVPVASPGDFFGLRGAA